MPESTSAVRNLFGCNMSFRRRVFDAIGDFRLGYGCDETEFCIRALHEWPQGLLIYKPEARVLHHVARSRMSWPYFVSRCYFEGGSKAVVTWLAGSKIGLASERAYTFRTLPRGFSRGLADAMLRRDRSGLARAGAICAGLAVTTAGYLVGRVSTVKQAHRRGWSDQTERAAR